MRPKPVPIRIVCDTCGLDYKAHGDSPSLLDCVRLLRDRWELHELVWQHEFTADNAYSEAGPTCG